MRREFQKGDTSEIRRAAIGGWQRCPAPRRPSAAQLPVIRACRVACLEKTRVHLMSRRLVLPLPRHAFTRIRASFMRNGAVGALRHIVL